MAGIQKKLDTYSRILELLDQLRIEKSAKDAIGELRDYLTGEVRKGMDGLKSNEIKQLASQMSQQTGRFDEIRSVQSRMSKSIEVVQVEMLKTLKEISGSQMAFLGHYARRNPVPGDDPINKRESKKISASSDYSFTYDVPSGWDFYFEGFSVTFNKGTTYEVLIDGKYDPALSEPIQQFGDNHPIYSPPEKAYHKVEIKVTNNTSTKQNYNNQIKGFIRRAED